LERLAESKGRRLLRIDFATAGPGASGGIDTSLNTIADLDLLPATR
jgi:hypothetical protein